MNWRFWKRERQTPVAEATETPADWPVCQQCRKQFCPSETHQPWPLTNPSVRVKAIVRPSEAGAFPGNFFCAQCVYKHRILVFGYNDEGKLADASGFTYGVDLARQGIAEK